MTYLVINLDELKVVYEAETKGLCNQWLLNNFAKEVHDRDSAWDNPFTCPYKILIVNKDKVRINKY